MNIVITGAGKGIGFELAKLLGAQNEHKVVGISRDCRQLQLVSDQYNIIPVPFNLVSDELDLLIATIANNIPSVDILIHNAGTLVNKPFEQITQEELRYTYEVNVFSVVRLTQKLLPFMKANKTHIVTISSVGGVQGSAKFAGLSAYSSSKGALTILTECMAEEFKDRGIHVNCLALGSVQTEMLEQAFPGYTAPLSAEQMAVYIANFAVNAHHYMNGRTVQVSLSTP